MQTVVSSNPDDYENTTLNFKLHIKKEVLVDVLNRVSCVATRGIKSEFDFAHNVTLQVNSKNQSVDFITTNGHLDAQWYIDKSIDENIVNLSSGKVTVDVEVLRRVCQSLGGVDSDDHIFSLEQQGKQLFIIDLNDTDNSKNQKKQASIETLNKNHSGISFNKPKNYKNIVSFETPILVKGISTIGEYIGDSDYKKYYRMICFHIMKNKINMISGNGKRFSIFSSTSKVPNEVQEEPENATVDNVVMYLLPADQGKILSSILDDQETKFYFINKTHYYIKNGNLRAVIKGIPNENYIDYWRHSNRDKDAVCIVDIKKNNLSEAVALMGSVEDKHIREQGVFHSCKCEYKENIAGFSVNEGRYQAAITVPCNFYNINDTKKYDDEYSWEFLHDVSKSSNKEYVRLHCLPDKIIIADMVNLESNKDDRNIPIIKPSEDGSSLRFFFASVARD